jgi:hypothetical protein
VTLWVSWFINSPFQPYTFSAVCLSRNSSRTKVIVIACPGASLRSVNIRRHRSPTRGIIAVLTGKNLLDFRRTRRLTFPRLRRARKLDVPGVCQPKTAPTRLREVSYHWAVGEQQGGYRNRLRKVFQPFTSCCLLQKDRVDPRAL